MIYYQILDYLSKERLIRSVFIGTIPIILFGGSIKLFLPYFFDNVLRSNLSIALVSFLMAIFMYIADTSKKGSINLKNHNYSDSFLIGLSQAFAILPGVSRSGVTISTALISGWERADSARFSFLLGIPAISIAAIVEFISSFNEISSFKFIPLIVGLIMTFSSSFIRDLYSLYELMPTAMKVKDEKNTNTIIVRFDTSTSPSWKDKKIFIKY